MALGVSLCLHNILGILLMDWSELMGFLVIYVGGAGLCWLVWVAIQSDLTRRRNYMELLKSGFKESYALHGTAILVFDVDRRELAVVHSHRVFKYGFAKIESWNHEWDVRNGRSVNHRFVINVLDPDHPRHVSRASGSECTTWYARMSALLA